MSQGFTNLPIGQKGMEASLAVTVASDQTAVPVTVSGVVMEVGNITISGAVTVANFPANQPVTIVGYPNPLNIEGAVTLSGSPSVTVAFPDIQSIQGTVNISGIPSVSVNNFPATQTVNLPPLLEVAGMVGLSGNPQVQVSNLPNMQSVQGTVNISGIPSVNINNLPSALQIIGSVAVTGNPVTVNVNSLPNETVNQGVAAALASGWPVKLTDGTNILGTNTNPLATTASVSLNLPPLLEVTGMVGISGNPQVQASLSLPPTLQVGGMVGISGNPQVTASLSLPPVLQVGGMVGVSGNPLVQAGPLAGATYPVTGAVTLSGSPAVSVTFPATQNTNIVGYPNPLNVQGAVTLSGTPAVSVSFPATQNVSIVGYPNPLNVEGLVTLSGTPSINVNNRPPLTMVTGMVGISGNPQVEAGPLPGAVYPVAGTVTLSGTPAVSVSFPSVQTVAGLVTTSGVVPVYVNSGLIGVSGTVTTSISNTPSVIAGPQPGSTYPVTGSVTLSGTPAVSVSFPSTQNVNLVVYPNPLTVNGAVSVSGSLPAGTNSIGAVTGAFFPANQQVFGSVTLSGTPLVSMNTVANQQVFGSVTLSGAPQVITGPLGGATYPVTGAVTISGTPTVNIVPPPLTMVTGLVGVSGALPAGTNSIGSVQLTDGSNTVDVSLTNALKTEVSGWFGSVAPTVGSKASASSIPVVIATDQTNIPVLHQNPVAVSGVPTFNITGYPNPLTVNGMVGVSGIPQVVAGPLGGSTYPVTGSVTISGVPTLNVVPPPLTMVTGMVGISGTPQVVVSPLGGATYPVTGAVTISGTPSINIAGYPNPLNVEGLVTLSGTPGINNAQWIGSTAPTVGSKTSANSIPVVIASDQGNLPFLIQNSVAISGVPTLQGDTASGASDTGNPVKIGGLAKTTNPTAVADGQRVASLYDKLGKQVVVPFGTRELMTRATTTIDASTSETIILASGGVGIFNDLTHVIVTNTDSRSGTRIDFRDTLKGAIIFQIQTAASGNVSLPIGTPIYQTTANTAWTASGVVSVKDLRIFVQAVQNK